MPCGTVSSDSVTIAVEDNGIGIAREQQTRVFERFYRVDKTGSKSDGGMGLGLSIVKNAALRMNGKINITSDLGKGTKIEITFPPLLLRWKSTNEAETACPCLFLLSIFHCYSFKMLVKTSLLKALFTIIILKC